MNKITIVTCVWKRKTVFELCLQNWTSLIPKPEIIVMGSEGDECEQLAKEYGCRYSKSENRPLGRKWNNALKAAGHHGIDNGTTHYLIMGSDDLISQKTWEYFQTVKHDFTGLIDFYFFDTKSTQVCYFKGYTEHMRRRGHAIGAGKLISHQALLSIGFEGFEPKRESALDFDIDNKLFAQGFNLNLIKLEQTGGICIDIKTADNMHKFRVYPNSIVYPFDVLQKKDSDIWQKITQYVNNNVESKKSKSL